MCPTGVCTVHGLFYKSTECISSLLIWIKGLSDLFSNISLTVLSFETQVSYNVILFCAGCQTDLFILYEKSDLLLCAHQVSNEKGR